MEILRYFSIKTHPSFSVYFVYCEQFLFPVFSFVIEDIKPQLLCVLPLFYYL